MANQNSVTKIASTFVKGLITEASPLTYPENASSDEDNCVLFVAGNRRRRLGVDYEFNNTLNTTGVSISAVDTYAQQYYTWQAPDNEAGTTFLVAQIGLTLYFYAAEFSPVSETLVGTVDLTPYIASFSNTTDATACQLSIVAGNGCLFCCGDQFEPISITWDDDEFTPTQIYIQIRDFTGVDDGLSPDDSPATLTAKHQYNLMNQGWNTPNTNDTPTIADVSFFNFQGEPDTYTAPGISPITQYFGANNTYPPNNKQWWVCQDANHVFQPNNIDNLSAGNTTAPRGHFVLNAFDIDRSSFSGVPSVETVKVIDNRPSTNSFFSGRVWYAMNNTVYYSQILGDVGSARQAGMCFQAADPTDQTISELVANDGGVIQIPEMANAVKLYPVGSGMLCFSTNGVWFITGTTSGFSATDLSISKLTPIGMNSPNSVVSIDSEIYWWSKIGIQGMSQKSGIFGPIQENFDKLDITELTIRTYYFTEISAQARNNVTGVYDPATNVIQWLFQSNSNNHTYLYDAILNFNLTLKAFYPWNISTVEGTTPYLSGVFQQNFLTQFLSQESDRRNTYLRYACFTPVGSHYKLTMAEFNSNTFSDWPSALPVGLSYDSYLETGFEVLPVRSFFQGDIAGVMRNKQAPLIICYFGQTEGNFVSDGVNGYTTDLPSSCTLTAKWDFSDDVSSGKWSEPVEAYRIPRIPFVDSTNLAITTGYGVISSKNKIRGRGKALQLRFECSKIGYDFNLIGWGVDYGYVPKAS